MKVDISWNGKMQFQTQTPSGHKVVLDAAEEVGGENQGPRPTEILLSAVGTCTGIDVVHILRKMRLQVESFSMEVSGERSEEHPRRFTKVHIHYILRGDLPENKVKHAIELSLNKYCSVSHSLNAQITASFEINDNKFSVDLV